MIIVESIKLQSQIATCRDKLYTTVKRKGVINDLEVIEVSRELDKLVLSAQKIIQSKRKNSEEENG